LDTKELLKKVRKIEIKTRRLSDHIFGGEYHSTFKGRGMTFSEVRQYQFGDDVRNIDWNVTARYSEPYIKELFIPPKKGKYHVLRIIRELLEFKPKSKKTDLGQAIKFLSNVMKKKAIVFVLSDFITDGYEQTMKIAGNKHDITGIRIYDQREETIPSIGLVQMEDEESGELMLVNTSSKKVRNSYSSYYNERVHYFKETFSRSGAGVIDVRTDESYVKKLLGYFKRRG